LATLLTGSSGGQARKQQKPALVDGLVQAFGREAAVYMGGPHASDEPALLVHGIAELEGCVQVAPGIYTGGLSAAIDGVLAGLYQPLDFRFFLGRLQYSPQNEALGTLVEEGAYQCLACARSLALKQCLGLPKPLFHEGMYFLVAVCFVSVSYHKSFVCPLATVKKGDTTGVPASVSDVAFVLLTQRTFFFVLFLCVRHEVLELCGGDLEAISQIELRKRIDLN
jgi:hypothetical protein